MDGPILQGAVEGQSQRHHGGLLHRPGAVIGEGPLQVGAADTCRIRLVLPQEKRPRGSEHAWRWISRFSACLPVDVDKLNDIPPAYLWPEEHPIGEARSPRRGSLALAAHDDGGMGPLDGG